MTTDIGAMTVKQFCERYSRSRASFWRDVQAGKIKPVRAGVRRILITNQEAERWLASLPKVAA
jgi:hypothetical protein